MATLYELTDEYQRLLEAIDSDDEQLVQDTIESTGLNDDIENKYEGYGAVITQVKSDIEAIKVEQRRLADLLSRKNTNLNKLKNSLKESMQVMNKKKVETPLFKFRLQTSHSVKIIDSDFIPAEFFKKQDPKISLSAIKKAIKNGQIVPGAEIEDKESLVIK